MISEGAKLIEDAKQTYLRKTGQTLANPGTSSKTYWTLINTILNKAKIQIIPPLLENRLFITDFTEKAQILMTISYFSARRLIRAVKFHRTLLQPLP